MAAPTKAAVGGTLDSPQTLDNLFSFLEDFGADGTAASAAEKKESEAVAAELANEMEDIFKLAVSSPDAKATTDLAMNNKF